MSTSWVLRQCVIIFYYEFTATKNCKTFITSSGVQMDEGYLIGIDSNIPLPVTQWLPNSNGGKAMFGALQLLFGKSVYIIYHIPYT